MFKKIELNHWRQFEMIDIDIDDHITILTGANGAGKTTLLGILNQHFGWSSTLLATPEIEGGTGIMKFLSGLWELIGTQEQSQGWAEFGKIYYDNHHAPVSIRVPKETGTIYQLNFSAQIPIKGMHIPSHRPIYSYKAVDSIPTKPKKREDYFNEYNLNIIDRFSSKAEIIKNISPSYLLKQSLIGLATFGYGNSHVVANKEYADLFEGFQRVLEKLLPKSLGFQQLEIRIPEVVLVTTSGNFSIDAASGGIASIIGLAWQIFMFSQQKERYVITIDEPENHLHPSMQRELIPNLIEAFPNAQFIVATHSPFIIGSSEKSKVYALAYNEDNRVYSRKLDMIDKTGNATKVLREVLGVPVTVPVWVEIELSQIVEKYTNQKIDEELFDQMRLELESKGLQEFMPQTISLVVERLHDKA